jgi:hypothetical protein
LGEGWRLACRFIFSFLAYLDRIQKFPLPPNVHKTAGLLLYLIKDGLHVPDKYRRW